MSREIGLPFCLAMRDFKAEKYKECVERLLPVRYMTHRLGGSFAQRDIIGWTLLEAALRAGQNDLALALANERIQRRVFAAYSRHSSPKFFSMWCSSPAMNKSCKIQNSAATGINAPSEPKHSAAPKANTTIAR